MTYVVNYQVQELQFKEKCTEMADKRNDEWEKAVKLRLANIIDAVAADVMYHHDCYLNFCQEKKEKSILKENIDDAMNEVYRYLLPKRQCAGGSS